MSNEEEIRQPDEQPLAEKPSEPTPPPQPVKKGDPVLGCMAAVGVALVAAGGLLYSASMCSVRAPGATRSEMREREQRRLEIEQAYQEDQAYRLSQTNEPPDREAPTYDGDAR